MDHREPPLRDVFAAQWLIAAVLGILFIAVQIFAPEASAALMRALSALAESSPQITEIAAVLAEKCAALLP